MSEISLSSSVPNSSQRRYSAEHPVSVLGLPHRVPLGQVLRVLETLTWLETQCAHSGSHWMDFKQGVAEALYRDRQQKRRVPTHSVRLRLDRAFSTGAALVEQRWRDTAPEDRDANPRYAADQQKAEFDEEIRAALSRADIGIDDDGVIQDETTSRLMQSAVHYHCAGGCYNLAYTALPLKTSDVLDMLRYIGEQRGRDTTITIWNPTRQGYILRGEADAARQQCGEVALGLYIEIWSTLRAMLSFGPEARVQVLKRLGGPEYTRFFAQHGIDLDNPDHERVVRASLQRFCPPKRDRCQSRLRLTHAIQPAQFVALMREVI